MLAFPFGAEIRCLRDNRVRRKAKHPACPVPHQVPRDKGAGMMHSGNLRRLHFIDPWSQKKRVGLFTISM